MMSSDPQVNPQPPSDPDWNLVDPEAFRSQVYEELRRLAAVKMQAERRCHTLQPTALAHEAYLRIAAQDCFPRLRRAQFFSLAAEMIRRILIDYAHKRATKKRGGDWNRVTSSFDPEAPVSTPEHLLELDEALRRLERREPRQAKVVELRFFGGMTEAEAAEALGLSKRTVADDWKLAKAWLYRDIDRSN